MSFSFSEDEFARVRNGARRVEAQAGSWEHQLEMLRATAEMDVRLALAALSVAPEVTQAGLDHFVRTVRMQLGRSQDGVFAAQRMCVAAREQRQEASRLVADVQLSCGSPVPTPASAVRHAVLVVDDYEDSRELVSLVLHEGGFIVRTASNGLEAIIAAYEMRPAVILMDLAMPVLGGLEATRLIKAIDAIRDARIIAHTGNERLDGGVEHLFAAVLQKPATPDVVLKTVRQWASVSP